MKKANRKTLWNYIQNLGVLIAAIVGFTQIINLFNKPEDYSLEALGEHHPYKIASQHQSLIDDYKKIISLNKTYIKIINKNSTSIENPDTEEQKIDAFWTFAVKNTCKKPIENIKIEIPFEGYFELTNQNREIITKQFKNFISVGDLNPSYSIKVNAWANTYGSNLNFYEKETKITHKYGYENISYPIKTRGFWGLSKEIKKYNKTTKIVFSLFPFLPAIIMIFYSLSIYINEHNSIRKSEK